MSNTEAIYAETSIVQSRAASSIFQENKLYYKLCLQAEVAVGVS